MKKLAIAAIAMALAIFAVGCSHADDRTTVIMPGVGTMKAPSTLEVSEDSEANKQIGSLMGFNHVYLRGNVKGSNCAMTITWNDDADGTSELKESDIRYDVDMRANGKADDLELTQTYDKEIDGAKCVIYNAKYISKPFVPGLPVDETEESEYIGYIRGEGVDVIIYANGGGHTEGEILAQMMDTLILY